MDERLAQALLAATQAGALGAAQWNGRGEKNLADKAAVEAMRTAFSHIPMRGTIVIGEGERDEAPMLYIGEEVGDGTGPELDIAIDPLEGTNLCARLDPGAISVLAAGPKGTLLHAPDTYMDKIAVGPKCKGKVDIDWPVARNIEAVARALGKDARDIVVLVMDRERHEQLIKDIRATGARVKLIRDGDVMGALLTVTPEGGVDLMLGIGGAPEGVLAAAALSSMGGDFQGRLTFEGKGLLERAHGDLAFLERAKRSQAEFLERAKRMGLADPHKKWTMRELTGPAPAFVATGVTGGEALRGVVRNGKEATTHSLITWNGTVKFIEARHEVES
jgi:fructose-1,6-bisphosphatase II